MRLKKWLMPLLALLSITFLVNVQTVNAQQTAWVYDETDLLTQDVLNAVDNLNDNVYPQQEIKPELGVEVYYNLPGGYRDIDEYRTSRFNQLGFGAEGHDSGILLIILLNDRKFAIETGYGIEPIITDLEASRILEGGLTDYLRVYSETNNPIALNNAVVQAVNEISALLERADNGSLFEDRAHQEQLARQAQILEQEENERRAESVRHFFMMAGAGIAVVVVIVGVRWYNEKEKRKKYFQSTLGEYKEFYHSDEVSDDLRREMPYDMFRSAFVRSHSTKSIDTLKVLRENKGSIINIVRGATFDRILENMTLPYPEEYYLKNKQKFIDLMDKKPDVTVGEFVVIMNDIFFEERRAVEEGTVRAQSHVERYLVNKDLPVYMSRSAMKEKLLNAMVEKYNLNNYGVKHEQVANVPLEPTMLLKSEMDEMFKDILIAETIENDRELANVSYGHGSRDDFILAAQRRAKEDNLSADDLLNRAIRLQILNSMRKTYTSQKDNEYEEERRRRARQARNRRASSSSSSSFGSSSRSSFGGRSGGGRSGGGGASGGW